MIYAFKIAGVAADTVADLDEVTKGKPCKLGRARMVVEESAALDDPGQLALLRIVEALASLTR